MGLELQLRWWMQPKVVVGVVVAAAVAHALLLLLLQRTREHKKLRLPPGPRGLPVLGNLLLVVRSKRWHADCYKMAETYGPIMWLRLGSQPAVMVQSPELAAEILKHQDNTFASRPRPGYGPALILYNGKDVLFSSGPHWRFMRKVMTATLLTRKKLSDFQHIRVEELGRMTETIGKHLGETVDLGYLLQTLNLNNITRMCMSKAALSHYQVQDPQHISKAAAAAEAELGSTDEVSEDSELVNLLRKAVKTLGVQGIGDAVPWLSFLDNLFLPKARLQQTQRQLHNYMCKIIQERRQYRADNPGTTELGDFVDVLLSDSSSSEADGESPITDTGICAQLIDIIIGGTDSSAVTTEWAMAELLRHPEVMAEAVQELDRVVGAARAVTEADLADLPFVQAVVKETLRLHPPAPMLAPHYSTRDATVGGYHVPANTTVLVNIWGVARDPAYWPHPHRFQPKRFLHVGGTPRADVDLLGHHFHLLPFGAGKRMCPGITLGFGMVTFSLATLLHTFTWALPADVARPEDLDMTERDGLAICRELSLSAVPHPKLANKLAS